MTLFVTMFIVWITIALVAGAVELHTQQQFGFAIAIASAGAIIAHASAPREMDYIWIEILTFVMIWAFLWTLLAVFGSKIRNNIHDSDDGFLSYIGRTVVASDGNENQYGHLKINDKVFRFTSKDNILKNDKIKIIDIKGVTFNVEKIIK